MLRWGGELALPKVKKIVWGLAEGLEFKPADSRSVSRVRVEPEGEQQDRAGADLLRSKRLFGV